MSASFLSRTISKYDSILERIELRQQEVERLGGSLDSTDVTVSFDEMVALLNAARRTDDER